MTLLQSILLGIVQGATEFLPVSSSGHLVLTPYLFGWRIPPEEAFIFGVLVQVATLLAVITYFWYDLLGIGQAFLRGLWNRQPFGDPRSLLGWYLILATLPAGFIGLALKESLERSFSNPTGAASFLLITAALLVLGEHVGGQRRSEWGSSRDNKFEVSPGNLPHNPKNELRALESLTWKDALWIGFFQALALFPGISRSGATITGGMARRLERPAAARFSFLMSLPIMLTAGLSAMIDLLQIADLSTILPTYLAGFLSAALVGYLAIRWLISYLSRRPLYVFSVYCSALGLVVLISMLW